MQDGYMQSIKSSRISLDPRTKLFVLFAVNFAAFAANAWYVVALATMMPLTLLLFARRYRAVCVCTVLCTLSIASNVFLVDATHGAANIILTLISGMTCRLLPGFLMGWCLVSTTTVSEFVATMERMHIPKQIIIPFSVMFRFFPTIMEESASITAAMTMRGVGIGKKRGGLISLIEYRLVPLFISCVKIGDELSCSALTRGLGSPVKRTNICKIGFYVPDFIYMVLASVAIVLFTMGKSW